MLCREILITFRSCFLFPLESAVKPRATLPEREAGGSGGGGADGDAAADGNTNRSGRKVRFIFFKKNCARNSKLSEEIAKKAFFSMVISVTYI